MSTGSPFPPKRFSSFTFLRTVSLLVKISITLRAAGAATVIGLFGFSAGAGRLPNSALRASPEIFLFALSGLKTSEDPKTQKRHRRRALETAPGGFGNTTQIGPL